MNYDKILSITQEFYALALKDILIGYHFRIIDDFDEHIPKIASFWQLQLTGTIEHKEHLPFAIVPKHLALKLNPGEVDRWVKLFFTVLDKAQETKSLTKKQVEQWKEKVKIFEKKIRTMAVLR